jgi:hypothetical protein
VIKKTGEEQRRRRRRGLMKNSHRHHFCFCNHCQKNKRDEIDEKKRSNIVVVVNIAVPHISSKIETDLAVNLDTNGKNEITKLTMLSGVILLLFICCINAQNIFICQYICQHFDFEIKTIQLKDILRFSQATISP